MDEAGPSLLFFHHLTQHIAELNSSLQVFSLIKIIPIIERSFESECFPLTLQCKEVTFFLSDTTSETKFTGKESQKHMQSCRDDDS